jgi:hypothetical protein
MSLKNARKNHVKIETTRNDETPPISKAKKMECKSVICVRKYCVKCSVDVSLPVLRHGFVVETTMVVVFDFEFRT